MVSERLNGIASMHIHQEIVPDVEKVIDLYALKNRRLNFVEKKKKKCYVYVFLFVVYYSFT